MRSKLLVLPFLLVLLISVRGQTPLKDKAAEDDAKLEKGAVELLRETSTEVGRLRTIENRISFNAELASLMWYHDDKEARSMYVSVVGDFKQLLSQLDEQMNSPAVLDDDDAGLGGLFGGYGTSKAERKFRIAMEVRKQIAVSLADHAPDLAFNFFYDCLNLISNPERRKQTEQADKYFESQLMQQIATTDAAKAAEYGKESIKRGLDPSHIDLLKKIYAKDADKGIEFGAVILSRLKSDHASLKNVYFYSSLLSFGDESMEASKKAGGKKPVYERNDLRDIAELFAQDILNSSGDDMRYSAEQHADQIDKYAPGRAAQIRAKFKSPVTAANSARVMMIDANTATISNSGYGSGSDSNANVAGGEALRRAAEERQARETAENKMMSDIKDLGSKSLPKEERDKVVEQSRKIISQTKGKDKKIIALSLLAAQVAHAGDKDLANEIMGDAERLVNPQPKNYQDFLLSWMLASGYAESNPDKAFPLLENTILRANDTLSAFVKVGEFIDVNDEMIDDGEVQVGMFGGSMMRGVTGELGIANATILSLARADFAKTVNLTNTFDRTEIRVLAKMMVLRAVLDKQNKSEDIEKQLTDATQEMGSAMPPRPRH